MSFLPESFSNLSNLERLHLEYNKIRELPESFYKLSKLSRLSLSGNPLENDILKYEFLLSMPNLNIIYFSNTPFGLTFKQPDFWGSTKKQLEKAIKQKKDTLVKARPELSNITPGQHENTDSDTVKLSL